MVQGRWGSGSASTSRSPPLKGQILRLEGLSPPLEYHVAGPGAVVQKADDKLWAAATEEEAGFDLSTTAEARRSLLERAARVLPSVTQSRVVEHTACLRPRTPDALPILGTPPDRGNVYLATGAGKKGIMPRSGHGKGRRRSLGARRDAIANTRILTRALRQPELTP